LTRYADAGIHCHMEHNTHIIPKGPVLVIMIGPSGSGKSTFCQEHFEDREVVSSDAIREELTGQFTRQDKNAIVFEDFHHRIMMRLRAGQRAVADATHLRDADRRKTSAIGSLLNVPIYYVVVNRSVADKTQTGGWRNDVKIKGRTLIENHEATFVSNEKKILSGDGDKNITVIDTRTKNQEVKSARAMERDPDTTLSQLSSLGYTKVVAIGDVHGNLDGLNSILEQTLDDDTHILFLGDIPDFGKQPWETISLVHNLVSTGKASMVRGNHDKKMSRYAEQTLANKNITGKLAHGNNITANLLKAMSPAKARRSMMELVSLVDQSPDWIELGDWMFAHAAVAPAMYGNPLFRSNKNSWLETMAMYGETDGTITEDGFPHRTYGWIDKMPKGKNAVLGHQIMSVVKPVVRTTNSGGKIVFLDTGSSKGIDGVPGFISFMQFDIQKKHGQLVLEPNWDFGRE